MTSLDEEIFRALNVAGSSTLLDGFMIVLSVMGTWLATIAFALFFWFKGRRELAIDALLLLGITTLMITILKNLIQRDRPFENLEDVNFASISFYSRAVGYSMPSGHATQSFSIAVLVLANGYRRAGIPLLVLAIGISISRVYLGLHWPSDVLFGALLGTAAALLFCYFTKRSERYVKVRGSFIDWLTKQVRRRTEGAKSA